MKETNQSNFVGFGSKQITRFRIGNLQNCILMKRIYNIHLLRRRKDAQSIIILNLFLETTSEIRVGFAGLVAYFKLRITDPVGVDTDPDIGKSRIQPSIQTGSVSDLE